MRGHLFPEDSEDGSASVSLGFCVTGILKSKLASVGLINFSGYVES